MCARLGGGCDARFGQLLRLSLARLLQIVEWRGPTPASAAQPRTRSHGQATELSCSAGLAGRGLSSPPRASPPHCGPRGGRGGTAEFASTRRPRSATSKWLGSRVRARSRWCGSGLRREYGAVDRLRRTRGGRRCDSATGGLAGGPVLEEASLLCVSPRAPRRRPPTRAAPRPRKRLPPLRRSRETGDATRRRRTAKTRRKAVPKRSRRRPTQRRRESGPQSTHSPPRAGPATVAAKKTPASASQVEKDGPR